MNDVMIPEHLKPSGIIERAKITPEMSNGIEVDSAVAAAQALMEKTTLVKVDNKTVELAYALGVTFETLGVLRIGRGSSLMNQQALTNTVIKLNSAIENATSDDQKAKLSYCLAYVSDKLAKVTKQMSDTEQESKAMEGSHGPGRRRSSFIPGTHVTATNVQIVNGAPTPQT